MMNIESYETTSADRDESVDLEVLNLLQSDTSDTCGFSLEWLLRDDDAAEVTQ